MLAKNYARSCAKSKPGTQNIGCNFFCRKIWILFKNGWEKQKSPAPQVPGQRENGYGVDLFRTKARTRRTIVPAARPRQETPVPNNTKENSGGAGFVASSIFSGQMLYKRPKSTGISQRKNPRSAFQPAAADTPNSSTGKITNWNPPNTRIR